MDDKKTGKDFDNIPVATIYLEASQQKVGEQWLKILAAPVRMHINFYKPETKAKFEALVNKFAKDVTEILDFDNEQN